MITNLANPTRGFADIICRMLNDVGPFDRMQRGSLDDNKMITNDNIFAKFGDEIFFIFCEHITCHTFAPDCML
jgi:hypothetical protein